MPDTTPVLVGVGTATQRCREHSDAVEPLELMRRALDATGVPEVLARTERIAVPRGRWGYGDPGRLLAAHVGAPCATTVLADVGILQQSLLGEAAQLIADGSVSVAVVVGGEAGHRLRQAARAGEQAVETPDDGVPDEHRTPDDELMLPIERAAGLSRAVGYYAVLESALRVRLGLSVEDSRDRTARTYSRFSEIASGNPEAWRRTRATPEEIRDAPMIAFPYTRAHTSSWSVDQAAALVLCSAEVAADLAVPREKWVYPVVAAESNHMVNVSRRAEPGDSPGARAVARAVLDHAAALPGLLDLYSPFPVAVSLFADALGVGPDRDPTVTGGMPWAGGPFNSYVLQATARMASLLRERGGTGLVSAVSGLMTKQGAMIWSATQPPRPFANIDVTSRVRADAREVEVVDVYTGPATVVAYTVLHIPDKPHRGVALLDLPDGRRTLARTEDPAATAAMQIEEWVGRTVHVCDGRFG